MDNFKQKIPKENLKKTFIDLININSLYPDDLNAQKYIISRFSSTQLDVLTDDFGNIIARFNGDSSKPCLMLNTHFDIPEDTPEPAYEVTDDEIKGTGQTILGADAKSAVAILVEVALEMAQNPGVYASIDFVFTRGEEQGLIGAGNLDLAKLRASHGLVIDQDGPVNEVVTESPGWIRFKGTFHGRTVHIREPENGVNALQLAAQAFQEIPMGFSDKSKKVTWNVGIINGGQAVNSIPAKIEFMAELRSFDEVFLKRESRRIENKFKQIAEEAGGSFDSEIKNVCKYYQVQSDNPTFKKFEEALRTYDLKSSTLKTFGASDANIFNERGIETIAIGSGYYNAHQYNETVNLTDMSQIADFLFEFARK